MGAIISQLLFQPPKPPSYVDDGKGTIIWLTCQGKAKEPSQNTEVNVQIPSVFLGYKGFVDILVIHLGPIYACCTAMEMPQTSDK